MRSNCWSLELYGVMGRGPRKKGSGFDRTVDIAGR